MPKSDSTKMIELQRARQMIRQIEMDTSRLMHCYDAMLSELLKGLELHREDPETWHKDKCDLMMLDCHVDALPRGTETGTYYAIDVGGSNVRAVRASFKETAKKFELEQYETSIRDKGITEDYPRGVLDAKAPAEMLFDCIASVLEKLMASSNDLAEAEKTNHVFECGLTFSFAMKQKRVDSGLLVTWSKEFATGTQHPTCPVVGEDICRLMNEAFARSKVPAKITCIVNDTMGTMITAGFEKEPKDPLCLIGLIVGTGVNACYYEPLGYNFGYGGTIINSEIGGFDKYLPACVIDHELDMDSKNYTHQRSEKMISGLYVAEVCRRMIVYVFGEKVPAVAKTEDELSAPLLAGIYAAEQDDTSVVKESMWETWKWQISTHEALLVKRIVDGVFDRSARLLAALIAALCTRTGNLPNGITVGVDGSMYSRNLKYRAKIDEAMREILGDKLAKLVKFRITSDGSGKGAACLAAALAHRDCVKV